jgi:hypothetical protein
LAAKFRELIPLCNEVRGYIITRDE